MDLRSPNNVRGLGAEVLYMVQRGGEKKKKQGLEKKMRNAPNKKSTWSLKKCLSSHARNIFLKKYVSVSILVFRWGPGNTKISQAALCLVGQVRRGRWTSRPGRPGLESGTSINHRITSGFIVSSDSWKLLLGRGRACIDQVQYQAHTSKTSMIYLTGEDSKFC